MTKAEKVCVTLKEFLSEKYEIDIRVLEEDKQITSIRLGQFEKFKELINSLKEWEKSKKTKKKVKEEVTNV